MLKPRGFPSRRGEKPGISELKEMPVVPPALKWQALQFLWPGSAMLPVSRNSVLPVLARELFSCERLEVEILLPAQRQLIGRESIEFFVGRHAEICAGLPIQRLGGVLRDGDNSEIAKRRAVVAPTQPFRRIRVAAVAGEIDSEGRIRPDSGVAQRENSLHRSQRELRLQVIETVRIFQDQSQASHEFGLFEVGRERRVVLRHKQRICVRQLAMKAGSMVKLLLSTWQVPQARPLPSNFSFTKTCRPCATSLAKFEVPARRRGIETCGVAGIVDEPHLAVEQPVEEGGGAGQDERVRRALVRRHDESAIRQRSLRESGGSVAESMRNSDCTW